jgi:hypothetical protein
MFVPRVTSVSWKEKLEKGGRTRASAIVLRIPLVMISVGMGRRSKLAL